jgi:hypothetical protein
MRLVVYCKNCSSRNPLHIKAADRVALKIKHGDLIEVTCTKCNARGMYEVNEVKAEQRFGGLISFVIFFSLMLLIIYLLWDYLSHQMSSLYLLPVGLFVLLLIYIVINKEMNNKVRNFNRS